MTSITRRWSCLPLSALAIGLTIMPAIAQTAHGPNSHAAAAVARLPKGFAEKRANVDGVTISYKIGGQGPVVVLLHGYTQTSHMWAPLMPRLATSHTVIAPEGKLEARVSRDAEARAWLATAADELRAMGIGAWLARAEALLAALGR
jgi:hypothetical protein